MIIKIRVNDNLYIELESMHHGYIEFKQSTRIMFNIVDNYLNINTMYDISERVLNQVIKKLELKGFMSIQQKQQINNKRKETLNKIIKDTVEMDRRETRYFKDRLSEVEHWIQIE